MRAILKSESPATCSLLAQGRKTILLTKTDPKLSVPFKQYLYCTKTNLHLAFVPSTLSLYYCRQSWKKGLPVEGEIGNGKVVGEVICDKIYHYTTTNNKEGCTISDEEMEKGTGLSHSQLFEYENGGGNSDSMFSYFGIYGLHVSEVKIYDKAKELGNFYRSLPEKVLEEGDYDCRKDWDVACMDSPEGSEYCQLCIYGGLIRITRPPASWCYVDEYIEYPRYQKEVK